MNEFFDRLNELFQKDVVEMKNVSEMARIVAARRKR